MWKVKKKMTAKPNTLTFGNLMERWVSLGGSVASVSRAQLAPTRKKIGCFSIASDKKHRSKNTRSYKKKLTRPILFPLKHGA